MCTSQAAQPICCDVTGDTHLKWHAPHRPPSPSAVTSQVTHTSEATQSICCDITGDTHLIGRLAHLLWYHKWLQSTNTALMPLTAIFMFPSFHYLCVRVSSFLPCVFLFKFIAWLKLPNWGRTHYALDFLIQKNIFLSVCNSKVFLSLENILIT